MIAFNLIDDLESFVKTAYETWAALPDGKWTAVTVIALVIALRKLGLRGVGRVLGKTAMLPLRLLLPKGIKSKDGKALLDLTTVARARRSLRRIARRDRLAGMLSVDDRERVVKLAQRWGSTSADDKWKVVCNRVIRRINNQVMLHCPGFAMFSATGNGSEPKMCHGDYDRPAYGPGNPSPESAPVRCSWGDAG